MIRYDDECSSDCGRIHSSKLCISLWVSSIRNLFLFTFRRLSFEAYKVKEIVYSLLNANRPRFADGSVLRDIHFPFFSLFGQLPFQLCSSLMHCLALFTNCLWTPDHVDWAQQMQKEKWDWRRHFGQGLNNFLLACATRVCHVNRATSPSGNYQKWIIEEINSVQRPPCVVNTYSEYREFCGQPGNCPESVPATCFMAKTAQALNITLHTINFWLRHHNFRAQAGESPGGELFWPFMRSEN